MTKIGLISDTHGYFDERIAEYLGTCDEVWHAGDIGNMETLEKFEALKPLRAVCGNIDGHQVRSAVPEIQHFFCEDVDVLIKHIGGYPGHYDASIVHQLRTNPPGLFISGHSHILKVMHDKRLDCLHINPGAAGKLGFHSIRTLVRFTVDGFDIRDLEVVELGKRG